jgi:hypothetical protein
MGNSETTWKRYYDLQRCVLTVPPYTVPAPEGILPSSERKHLNGCKFSRFGQPVMHTGALCLSKCCKCFVSSLFFCSRHVRDGQASIDAMAEWRQAMSMPHVGEVETELRDESPVQLATVPGEDDVVIELSSEDDTCCDEPSDADDEELEEVE